MKQQHILKGRQIPGRPLGGWPRGCSLGSGHTPCSPGWLYWSALPLRRGNRWPWSRPKAGDSWLATSPEGTPAIYALDESARRSAGRNGNGPELAIVPPSAQRSARVHGRHVVLGACGSRGAGSFAARSYAAPSPSDSTPWNDPLCPDSDYASAGNPDGHDSAGALLVVFHFLRQALGTQTAPSNPTLLGLALMMTWFLMTPC